MTGTELQHEERLAVNRQKIRAELGWDGIDFEWHVSLSIAPKKPRPRKPRPRVPQARRILRKKGTPPMPLSIPKPAPPEPKPPRERRHSARHLVREFLKQLGREYHISFCGAGVLVYRPGKADHAHLLLVSDPRKPKRLTDLDTRKVLGKLWPHGSGRITTRNQWRSVVHYPTAAKNFNLDGTKPEITDPIYYRKPMLDALNVPKSKTNVPRTVRGDDLLNLGHERPSESKTLIRREAKL